MPTSGSSLISRHALSLWFFGIAALGLLQFFGKAYRGGHGFQPSAIAWLWLAGSLLLIVLAILLAWRERRSARSS